MRLHGRRRVCLLGRARTSAACPHLPLLFLPFLKLLADPTPCLSSLLTSTEEGNSKRALWLGSMASDDDERVYYEDLASALAADGLELLVVKQS